MPQAVSEVVRQLVRQTAGLNTLCPPSPPMHFPCPFPPVAPNIDVFRADAVENTSCECKRDRRCQAITSVVFASLALPPWPWTVMQTWKEKGRGKAGGVSHWLGVARSGWPFTCQVGENSCCQEGVGLEGACHLFTTQLCRHGRRGRLSTTDRSTADGMGT